MKPNIIDRNIHRPKHLYFNNKINFITGRTYQSIKYFEQSDYKKLLCMVINQSSENFEISIYGWVVLDNHYHLLIGIWDKKSNEFHPNQRFVFNSSDHSAKVEKNYSKYKLVEFIRKIHKDSARKLNMQDSEKGRIIWYQYWDRIIRTKKEFFGYLNYIHFNPIKHNKVKDFNNLAEYQYSSFIDFLKKYGFSWISDCYEKYSIAD